MQIPRAVRENLIRKIDFIEKTLRPLVKGYRPPTWISTEETMEALGIGKERLRQLRDSGKIRYNKFGKKIEYYRRDIENYKQGNIIIPSAKRKPPRENNI